MQYAKATRRTGSLRRARTSAYLVSLVAVAAITLDSAAIGGSTFRARSNGAIAYTAVLSASQIYESPVDGGRRHVAANTFLEYEPSASPDGTKIAYVSTRSGGTDIFVSNRDGSNVQRLTDDPSYDFDPAWSPDGTQISFSSGRSGNSEIYVMNADGSGVTRLTTAPGEDENPAWSPDGTRIVFWSDADGDRDLYVMRSDGAERGALTRTGPPTPFRTGRPTGRRSRSRRTATGTRTSTRSGRTAPASGA